MQFSLAELWSVMGPLAKSVVQVMDECRAAGVTTIGVLTKKPGMAAGSSLACSPLPQTTKTRLTRA